MIVTIFSNKTDFWLIKFPIVFPIAYLFFLFQFPQHENLLALLVLCLMAEPHFGATWTIFMDRQSRNIAFEKNKVPFVYGSLFIIMISVILFIVAKQLFFLLFFIFNVYHVTRQSFGICNLYCKNIQEKNFQKFLLYSGNFVVALIAAAYLMLNLIDKNTALIIGFSFFAFVVMAACYQFYLFRNIGNIFTTATGLLIFTPSFFVEKPIHAILCGVTMHYSQYLILTAKIYFSKRGKTQSLFNSPIQSILKKIGRAHV